MLYFFTGNSDFLIKQELSIWKKKFISKFGEFNLIHIKELEKSDNNFLIENISAATFLSEKKLVIIDLEKTISDEKQTLLINILDKIPDDNIILINYCNPDKRLKIYKELIKNAEHREYNIKSESDTQSIISKIYGDKVKPSALSLISKYKSGNLNKITSELDKLLILFKTIDPSHVKQYIVPELEESIFQLIDDLLNKNTIGTIDKMNIILNNNNIYAFYNNLLANLRTTVYIFKLKSKKKTNNEISMILNLGNKSFLISKKYTINFNQLKSIYVNLVSIDKKMKSGMLNGTKDSDFKFELEKILIEKKSG